MKFTEGMWKVRSGIQINWMSHVERIVATDDASATLLLARYTRGRGDTLNAGTLTAAITAPREGITAVKFSHHTGAEDLGPHFPLVTDDTAPPSIENVPGEKLTVATGPLTLAVNTAPNALSFDYTAAPTGKRLTGHSFRSIAFVSDATTAKHHHADSIYAQKNTYLLLELDLAVHEKIYGLGERFGPFVKNGQAIDIWNEDGGTSSELAYKNVPFYLSSRGYGVFVNHPGRVHLEVQSERTTRVNIVVKGESLEYMVIAGPTPKDILRRYTALTGRPSLPPAWSYGLWLTTSFTTSYSEETVTSFLDGFRQRDIPLSVFHFDCFWMKSYQWCDFQFDEENFPDPKAYLDRLKARGFKTCVWINPYIGQASPLFAEGKKNRYFVMRADTPRPTVWQWDEWQAGMALVDFTNPKAAAWFAGHLKRLMDMGVDAFKTDFGERIPFDEKVVRYADNSDAEKMHNFYTFLYNKCVFETMQAHGKAGCLFARSATAGGQQFPVHWGGDCESTFEAMAETLRGGLSLALSGFAFWAHDIGGFEGLPEPALYKRWVQFGALSSHTRLHGSSSYRVPWIYDEKDYPGEVEACSKVLRESVVRKLALMPYMLRTALEAKESGTPVMRAMLVEFGETDPNVWSLDTQYMLGGELLVAPVFTADGEVSFYVPRTGGGGSKDAKWRSWFDRKKTYDEGQWYTETHGFDTMPMLVRPGAVVPYNPSVVTPDGDVVSGLQVLVNGPLAAERTVEVVEAGDVSRVSRTFTVGRDLKVAGLAVEVVDLTV
ncbi:Alpha-glucosidase [Drechslerella dactyloides]|uniref:alpha-D-xyloside xylohydrolase n=1 Tax=Drechslerella dactyloides TaxID=74499 RepID=A0AAD6ISU7_DREDA|nr:Alpha-glucosidase [Drechslerella dactyloides]